MTFPQKDQDLFAKPQVMGELGAVTLAPVRNRASSEGERETGKQKSQVHVSHLCLFKPSEKLILTTNQYDATLKGVCSYKRVLYQCSLTNARI